MATKYEQALALSKEKNISVPEAVAQVRNQAPVSATSQINQDQLAANRARVQSQIASGERPAVGTSVTPQAGQTQAQTPSQAPVPTTPIAPITTPSGATMNADGTIAPAPVTTPTTAPVTPTAVTTPKILTTQVTPTKTEPVIDYTQAQGREQEIMTNLEKFKTQGMTPDQIKGASGYEQATPEKKAIIEGFLNPVKLDAGTIFSTLRAGGSVPMSDTPEYRQAQARYNTFKRFSTYDVASLSTAMQQGDLLMGTQAYNDVISDPNMLAKIQKARIFMNGEVDIVKIGEKQGQYVMTQNPTVAKALEDGYITAEEYNQMTSTPEVEAQAKVVSEAKTKYDEYKRQLEQISDDVDKEYEGKETTDSFRSAIKANRDKAVRRLYNSASDDLQNASGLYTELKNSSTQRLELNMKQYEQKQADARQIEQEQRQMQAQKDLIQYKSDFEKQQAQEALNDPETQIKATMDEFEKMGITSQGSLASKIAEFKTSGLSLPEYVNNLRKLYMAKPEYQRIQTINQGKLSDIEKFQMQNAVEDRRDLRNFAQQKELAKFNNDLNRQEFLFKIENDPAQKAKTLELEKQLSSNKSLFDVLGKNVGTYEGNRGYDLAGNLGDPLPAGGNWTVKSVDTAGEQVGSIFIGGKGSKPWGNTVVMEDENGNEIRYSHLQNIGVKEGDILGFGDIVGTRGNTGNVKGANGETLTAEQLKAGRGAHVDIEIKSKGADGKLKLLSNSEQVNFLKGLKAGGGISSSSLPLYRAYMEDNKLPSKDALAGLGMTSEQFTNNASTGYDQFLRSKENEINSTYPTLQIQFTPSYASLSATQREKLNESMTKIGDIDMRLEKLKKLFDENGTEVLPTKAKKEMQSLKQQIILKAKEVENLGVLNGPDLGILESLIPETTGIMSGLFSFDDNTKTTLNSIQSNYRSDAKTKGINYGAKIGFKGMDEPMQQQTNTGVGQTYQGYTIKGL